MAFDWDRDGDFDLIVGDEDGRVAFVENEGLQVSTNDAKVPVFSEPKYFQQEADTLKCGALATPVGCDWDGDGKFDFLVNSANADFLKQIEAKGGQWIMANAGTVAEKNIEGHDVSPTVVDFDGDQIPDFLGGAEDGRLYFQKNPRSTDE